MEQRWLSKTGICTVLGINERILREWVKNKYIVQIGKHPTFRYLDPTPGYAEQLKLGQALHTKENQLPFDISTAALLTLREVAEIVGWKLPYAQQYMWKYKVPFVKIGRFRLYAVDVVRNILWQRQDRSKASKQVAPFLLSEILRWFVAHYAAECEEVPTDTAFAEDELLQRKLTRMMQLPSG